ncbi:MAG: hypothetical protein OXI53_08065 [Nitrospira sp.]|nr:hypothetical protein [Nitrospira sp.]MDE0487420.1 hypothetical protein [Nitrospira sp.]
MKKLARTDELTKVASRVLWFEPPEKALSDPVRFLTYAMTYGTHEDMKIIRQYVSDEELLEALDQAPPRNFRCPVLSLLERHSRTVSHPTIARTGDRRQGAGADALGPRAGNGPGGQENAAFP